MSGGFEEALRRGDEQVFDDVTLENQVAQTDGSGDPLLDEHGNIKWADKTTTDVPGEISTRGTPNYTRRADGIDTEVDAIVWISDPNVTFTSGEDSRTQKATRVVVNGRRYKVLEVYDERNGRLRGHVQVES